jgi:hypothetical protein
MLLRRSVARLNAAGLFDPIDEHGVHILTDARTGIADIVIQLREAKHGRWNFSGPLPLSASIGMRLPAWGRGVLELSTYSVSFNLLAYSTILKLTTARRFFPVLSRSAVSSPAQACYRASRTLHRSPGNTGR